VPALLNVRCGIEILGRILQPRPCRIVPQYGEGDRVAVRWAASGTHLGNAPELDGAPGCPGDGSAVID
jgi:hypothetical protein